MTDKNKNIKSKITTTKNEHCALLTDKNHNLNENKNKIEKTFSDSLSREVSRFNEIKKEKMEKIDILKEYIAYEIEIKIESLKIALSEIKPVFEKELEKIIEEWTEKEINESVKVEHNKILESIENLDKNFLCNYQNHIKGFRQVLKEYEKLSVYRFIKSETIIDKDDIGQIVFETRMDPEIKTEIFNYRYIHQNFDSLLSDVCALPNSKLLLIGAKNFFLSDTVKQNFETVKIDETINYICVTHDGNENIFLIGNYYKNSFINIHVIVKVDLKFKKQKIFDDNKKVLRSAHGICYYEDHVFVCDYEDKSVHKFDSNLTYKATYPLKYSPSYIKNIKNVAMVKGWSSIYFYDLTNFTLKSEYNNVNGSYFIGASCTHFYSYNLEQKILKCYSDSGTLNDEIKVDLGLMKATKSSMTCFNSNMYIVVGPTLTYFKI